MEMQMSEEVKNGKYKDKYGNILWYKDGKLNREDGPAVEHPDGHQEWWIEEELHRKDGPAIEYASGKKEWWLNGKYHREDGPAVEYANGDKEWWINGVEYTEELFNKYQLNKKLEATLEEKPSIKRAKI